jgi:hypothetical protein
MPIIPAVDRLVGSKNAMRIDARSRSGEEVTLRVTHEDLEDGLGEILVQSWFYVGLETMDMFHHVTF